jgi:hypothetical protein
LSHEHHIAAVWNYSWHQNFIRNIRISQLNLLNTTDFSDMWCLWQSDSFMWYKTAFRDSFIPCCLDKPLTDINYEFSLGLYVELRNCWAVICKPDPRNPHVLGTTLWLDFTDCLNIHKPFSKFIMQETSERTFEIITIPFFLKYER